MADNFKYFQTDPYALAGGGAVAGATSVILKSMTDIDGTLVTMTAFFGTKGFATIEPGNGSNEEQIVFTGITQNSNGTATLTGVSSVTFASPYTETSGLLKTHAGSTSLVISNTSGFYNSLSGKSDDETITGTWTFPSADPTRAGIGSDTDTAVATAFVTLGQLSRQAISGASNAATTVKGIVQLPTQAQADARTTTGSTGALLAITPDVVRSTLLSDYVVAGGSANALTLTPTPAITAYAAGQTFTFKVSNPNTGTALIAVSGLSSTVIFKDNGILALNANDLIAGQIAEIEYNGKDGFMLMSPTAPSKLSTSFKEIYAATSSGNDTYAITVFPIPTAYVVGQTFFFKADVANTGAASLNVNNLGAMDIRRPDGTSIATNDIIANQIVQVTVNSSSVCTMASPPARPFRYNSGNTSYDVSTASGVQNIPHGLGVVPISYNVFAGGPAGNFAMAVANNGISNSNTGNNVTAPSFAVGTTTGNQQTGVLSADATNIIITWTKGGTPTGTAYLIWQAFA